MGERDMVRADTISDPIEEAIAQFARALFEVGCGARQSLGALDDQIDTAPGAKLAHEGGVAIGFRSAQAMVQMRRDQLAMTPRSQGVERVE